MRRESVCLRATRPSLYSDAAAHLSSRLKIAVPPALAQGVPKTDGATGTARTVQRDLGCEQRDMKSKLTLVRTSSLP